MGFLDKLFGKKEEPAAEVLPAELPPEAPAEVKKLPGFPKAKDGHKLETSFTATVTPAEGVDLALDVLGPAEKEVSMTSDGERISLIYAGEVFGYVEDKKKAALALDWETRELPYDAYLLCPGNLVQLRFYRDKRLSAASREQSVCRLQGCKSPRRQERIWCLSAGSELSLDTSGDSVMVFSRGESIGKLPPGEAERYMASGAYLAFVEAIEDDREGNAVPTVRIYW